VTNPEDFDTFWDNAKKELAAVPMDAKMTLLPDRCTEKTNVYHLNLQNNRVGTRVYGILSVPKKKENIRHYSAYQVQACVLITEMSLRPTKKLSRLKSVSTESRSLWTRRFTLDMGQGVLNGYPAYNMDDKDKFY
jgi:cephalosporin-C deacetylase